ncbi:olfactory receptor 1L4-like [Anomaloglossus baeobatrachus]|uniref:olfactory receptor 1L4-like n=1 Tax=Anomaloglossus baeobatrachus TaxID=238106 RepID=UPI003F4F5E10
MLELPKLLYIFRTIPLLIKKKPLQKLQTQLTSFVCGKTKPRVAQSTLNKNRINGGLGMPNIRAYYQAMTIKSSQKYWNRGDKPAWVGLEDSYCPNIEVGDLVVAYLCDSKKRLWMILINNTEDGFILLGFSEYPYLQIPLFMAFLFIYLLTLTENTLLIVIIFLDPHLHTPMYFFLCNLSFADICMTTVVLPRFLLTSLDLKYISYSQCFTQLYLYMSFQALEYLLLTVMSYDRYVAICNPLRYSLLLNKKVCVLLVALSFLCIILNPSPVVSAVSVFSFCSRKEIDHFFCDLMPLLKISCTDPSQVEAIVLIDGAIFIFFCFGCILFSYVSILLTILKIQTAFAKQKAFSTCSSHLMAILMLQLTLIFVYFQPQSDDPSHNSKDATLLNTVMIPILNPVLYSLRNKDVKSAFIKLFKGKLKVLKDKY